MAHVTGKKFPENTVGVLEVGVCFFCPVGEEETWGVGQWGNDVSSLFYTVVKVDGDRHITPKWRVVGF